MKILTRYILKEMIGPTLLGFGFYTFIILMKSLFDFAEMIIKRSLPLSTVLQLLGLSLPHIIVLTIPMSLLFGIMIAVGRLSADSEIIAMRSAGISMGFIYRPVFYFSMSIFLLNLYLMNVVLPRGNQALQSLRSELFTTYVEKEIKPRVFMDEYPDIVLYVNDADPQGRWKGVFLSDVTETSDQKIVVAKSGYLSMVGPKKEVWLDLQDAETHVFKPIKPERYDLNRNASQRFLLPDKYSTQDTSSQTPRQLREMNVLELFEAAKVTRGVDPVDYRLAQVEIHKKFAIPFACIAFGVVALPLGLTNRRGGKSSGFSLSILIILVYYVMINNGEDLARSGKVHPALAMWAANILLTAFGIYLLRRANADIGAGGHTLTQRIGRGWKALTRSRKPSGPDIRESPSLLSRFDIPFPNILDRYILKEFLKILALVLVSTAVLFLIVDYTEIIEEVTTNRIPLSIVLSYYRYFVLQVLNYTLPLSVLLGTLITFGILSKNNEVTALKANGVSLYRVALPIVIVATGLSVFSYFLLDFVLPYSNQRVTELKSIIRGSRTPQSFSIQQRQWVFGKGRYLFNFLSYDREARSLSQVQVFEFDPVDFKLTRRVWAEEARFDGTGWVFVEGWIRSFLDDGSSSYTPIVNPIRLHYPERPQYFEVEVKLPSQMTFAELRRYIQSLRSSGYSAEELSVKLYEKTSWPFITLVMALIALPFSFKIGKRGALYGIGIALFLAFTYWTIFGIFTKFGEVGNLPALLSAWSANILFALAAIYLFLRVET